MSTSRQCIRRRKQARLDKRYRRQKCHDAAIAARRQAVKVQRERDRAFRARRKT